MNVNRQKKDIVDTASSDETENNATNPASDNKIMNLEQENNEKRKVKPQKLTTALSWRVHDYSIILHSSFQKGRNNNSDCITDQPIHFNSKRNKI
mmetsp:Transcript_23633/g.34838  ORF Transcript_23633/g.34838 Transcript_23633/m.34838 type:complete len:95 (-) Transcript_23633:22-306(-)